MKKRLLILAICMVTMSFTACGNKDTEEPKESTPTTTASVIEQKVDTKENVTASTTTDKVEATTAPTETTPEQTTTSEPTKEPVGELTWENSGLSYEVIETVNMSAERTTDTLYIVTTTNNHNDNTYHINTGVSYHFYTLNNCYLTPGNTFEFTFLAKEDADTFVANITANPMKDLYVSIAETNGHWLFAPEIECTIVNTEPYGNDKKMTFNYDDTSWYFDKDNGMKVAYDEWYGFVTTTALHFYDANGNLVGVYAEPFMYSSRDKIDATITIRPDVDFTNVTAITFGQY